MGKRFEGMLVGKGLKFGIVLSRFNEFFSGKLLEGAQDALLRHGVNEDDVEVVRVPGSFEIPLIAQKLALSASPEIVGVLICIKRTAKIITTKIALKNHNTFIDINLHKNIMNTDFMTFRLYRQIE